MSFSKNYSRYDPERYVGKFLREGIAQAGTHMAALEERLGLSGGSLCRLAKGDRTTDRATALRIANALSMPFEDVFQLSETSRRLLDQVGTPVTNDGEYARFWSKVAMGQACWEWKRSRNKTGYGQININGRPRLAHRVSWEIANGPIPEGMHVCHKCDNPPCVRPDHLHLGVREENMRDMAKKGRASRTGARLSLEQVQEIRDDLKYTQLSQRAIADKFGVSKSAVQRIASGESWSNI